MIIVYLEGFAQRTLRAEKADISVVGQREILTVRNYADNAIAQFDMNSVVGWTNYDYDYDDTDDGGDAE